MCMYVCLLKLLCNYPKLSMESLSLSIRRLKYSSDGETVSLNIFIDSIFFIFSQKLIIYLNSMAYLISNYVMLLG